MDGSTIGSGVWYRRVADTESIVWRFSDNGFGLTVNYNFNLGSGEHTATLLVDGVESGTTTFSVLAMSTGEFATGLSKTATVADFPKQGHSVTLEWSQAQQNFNIVAETIPSQGEGGVLDDGVVDAQWNNGLGAFDEAISYATCVEDGGEACPSLSWATVDDEDRGTVLEVTYADADAGVAAIFFEAAPPVDMSGFAGGMVHFDVKVVNAGNNTTGWIMKQRLCLPLHLRRPSHRHGWPVRLGERNGTGIAISRSGPGPDQSLNRTGHLA